MVMKKKQQEARSDASSSGSGTNTNSSESDRSSDSGTRFETRNAQKFDNYVVTTGIPFDPKAQVNQAPAAPKDERVQVNAAFPRHPAQAGKKTGEEVMAEMNKEKGEEENVQDNEVQDEVKPNVQKARARTAQIAETAPQEVIYVESIAELFSPKEDIERDFGVNREEFDKMVQTYRKNHEYKERKLPVSRNFNIDMYNNSKQELRSSAVNVGKSYGSKRGQIMKDVWRKHAATLSVKKSKPQGDVMSLIPNQESVERVRNERKERRNPGKLVVNI